MDVPFGDHAYKNLDDCSKMKIISLLWHPEVRKKVISKIIGEG